MMPFVRRHHAQRSQEVAHLTPDLGGGCSKAEDDMLNHCRTIQYADEPNLYRFSECVNLWKRRTHLGVHEHSETLDHLADDLLVQVPLLSGLTVDLLQDNLQRVEAGLGHKIRDPSQFRGRQCDSEGQQVLEQG
jgi:hypothetical protein